MATSRCWSGPPTARAAPGPDRPPHRRRARVAYDRGSHIGKLERAWTKPPREAGSSPTSSRLVQGLPVRAIATLVHRQANAIYNPLAMLKLVAAVLLALHRSATRLRRRRSPTRSGPIRRCRRACRRAASKGRFSTAARSLPGTIRHYWVYVPAQYDGQHAGRVMVFQDGHRYVDLNGEFRVPVVFDNLIHKKEMPVTIGIFINPGHFGETYPRDQWRGNNRSFEYDTLGDRYARFLDRRDPARGRQEVQRSRPTREQRAIARRQLGRHLRVHRRLGAARRVSQGAEPHRQLHQHPRRRRLPGSRSARASASRSASSCRTATTTSTTSTATGRWPTSRWRRR